MYSSYLWSQLLSSFMSFFLSFFVWFILPTCCRCRGLPLRLIRFNDTHTHNTHTVGLLWTRDQPVAETSTWQHTTFTGDNMHPAGLGIVKSDDFANPTEPTWSSHEVESFPEKLEIIRKFKEFPALLKTRRRVKVMATAVTYLRVCVCVY
jgi:hypothetical protein